MKRYQSILICAALSSTVSAQTAMQLFNPAAKEFIYGNTPAASNLVAQALIKFPDDEKLQKLKKLIEEQQQQQKKNDQQKQQQQNKNDQQKQDQQKNDPQKKQQDQDKQKQEQEQKKQNQQQQPDQADQKQPQDQQAAQPQQAGTMSKEEARQLLDAMKQDEQDQRANLTPYLGAPVRVDKDW